jgi:hypothetical protein
MIYLWFPGFIKNTQEVDISLVVTPWNDYQQDVTTIRNRIQLRDPNWITDVIKQQNIQIRRSMNDTVRTFVTNDRKNMDMRECTLHFENVRKERRVALEHFLLCAEGGYIGYKDPYGKCHVLLLGPSDTPIVTQGRAGGGVIPDGNALKTIEDEVSTIDINVIFVRDYDQVTIDG